MGDIEATCDRIVVLEDGHVAEEGDVAGFIQETPSVAIDVDDNRDGLVKALEARGIKAVVEGLSVVVEHVSDAQYDDIRDAIVEADASLRRLAPQRRQLADIFRARE